jgi:CheY-like chemotaxis protein
MFICSNLITDLEQFVRKKGLSAPLDEIIKTKFVKTTEAGISWELAISLFNLAAPLFKNQTDIDEFVCFLLSDESASDLAPSRIARKIYTSALLFEVMVNFVGRSKFPAVNFTADFCKVPFTIKLETPLKSPSPDFMITVLKRYLELLPTKIGVEPASIEVTVDQFTYMLKIKPSSEKNIFRRIFRLFKDFLSSKQLIIELLRPDHTLARKFTDLVFVKSSLEETLGLRGREIRQANDQLSKKIVALEEIEAISGSGSWSIDTASKTVVLSKNAARLFDVGVDATEISISAFIACIHIEDQSEFLIAYSRLKADMPDLYLELRVVKADGCRILQQRGRLEGNIVIGSIFDVTNLRKNELRLAEERELAIEANRHKSQFLASMSHEIRTPMTSVLGFAELIINPKSDPEKLTTYVDTIIRNGKMLLAIIDDLLDLSKLEAGYLRFNVVACELNSLIEDTMSAIKSKAKERNVNLILNIANLSGTIQTDPARFSQVLINTIGNAVKMSMPGDIAVHIRPSSLTTETPGVEVLVDDKEHLISPEFFKLLFTPYHAFEPEKQKMKSTVSLSLVLAKALANAMEGDICKLSDTEPLNGFSLSLQALSDVTKDLSSLPNLAKTPSDLAVGHASLSQSKILIAEDNKDIQEILSNLLHDAGATTKIANNGLECLGMIEKYKFDMVLIDLQMPIMDGFETIEKLRAKGYNLPIIVVTAYALSDERERCLKAGCTDFITKPINGEVLLKTLIRNKI